MGSFAPFSTLEEVIDRANDSLYGLAAGVWSSNINTCMAVAEGVDAGTVWVNGMMSSWGYQAPFGALPFGSSRATDFALGRAQGRRPVGWCAGGPKQTGGGRTNGKQGLEEYLISKTVSINLNN